MYLLLNLRYLWKVVCIKKCNLYSKIFKVIKILNKKENVGKIPELTNKEYQKKIKLKQGPKSDWVFVKWCEATVVVSVRVSSMGQIDFF